MRKALKLLSLWFITALNVVEGVHLQNPCPRYVTYYCACSLVDIAEEKQLKMCHYGNLENSNCHPCPESLQEDINCNSCDDDECPICSLQNFGAGKGRGPHTKQKLFVKFSRNHGILYIQPIQNYSGYYGDHLENVESPVLHETSGTSYRAVMPNISFAPSAESFAKHSEYKPLNIGITYPKVNGTEEEYDLSEQKRYYDLFKSFLNDQSVKHEKSKKLSKTDFQETKNDEPFKMSLANIFLPGHTFSEINKSQTNLDDTKYAESYNEELKHDVQFNHTGESKKRNSLPFLPFEEMDHMSYKKFISSEQGNSLKNFEKDQIISLHISDDEIISNQNITAKLETQAGDKCSFISVPNDSSINNSSRSRTVRFQCLLAKEPTKLSIRDYFFDLHDINGTVQDCISDIKTLNVQEKIQIVKTKCNVSLPLTVLFKYIQLAASAMTKSRSVKFAEAVRIRGGNFINEIEFVVEIVNISQKSKKSTGYYKKIHKNINGEVKIEIRLHLKKNSEKKIENEVDDIGNFFADIPLHGLTPKLKLYQIGDTKFKFSKDGLKVKISSTNFSPNSKLELNIYELLNYFSNRFKSISFHFRTFITIDGMDEAYTQNKLNLPQTVAQKNDWIDELLLKMWFGNNMFNFSDSNQKNYNKLRKNFSQAQISPGSTKQNILSLSMSKNGILENHLERPNNKNYTVNETENNNLSDLGNILLHNALNFFVDEIEDSDFHDNFTGDIDNNSEKTLSGDRYLTQHDLFDIQNERNNFGREFESKHWIKNWLKEDYANNKLNVSESIFQNDNWIGNLLHIVMQNSSKLNISDFGAKKNYFYVTRMGQQSNKPSFPARNVINNNFDELRIDSASGNIFRNENLGKGIYSKLINMGEVNINQKLQESLKHDINKPYYKPRENLTLFIINLSENPKVLDLSAFAPSFTLKRVYRDVSQFPLWASLKNHRKPDKIVMTNQSVMKFFNLSQVPQYESQNVSNALWFQYRKYVLIPKINETLQRKKLKNSDIFKMLNASVSTLKKSKIYNPSCEICSVIYKIMLNSGFKNDPNLVENDNSSVIVVMNKPQFISHRHKSKFRANGRKNFKKPDENNDFIIQMNVNFLFLSSYDYEKLSQTNALKNYPLWNSPWRDINKNFAFRIPNNFISRSKILKLSGLVRHRNLEPAIKDLMNQGQLIEELQKLLFAILSKMHNRKQTASMEDINNANSSPSFKSEKSKLEKSKKPVYDSEAKDFSEVNLKEKRDPSQNFAAQDSHKNYDEISISTYDSDKSKRMQKNWREDKTESLDSHESHKVTKQGISPSLTEVAENNGTKIREIQDFQLDSRMVKDLVERKKASKDDPSDFNNVTSKNKSYHFSITESFENSSRAAVEVNLKKDDNENISKKSNTRRRKPLIYPINEKLQSNESVEKLLHELKSSDNASNKKTNLDNKTSITVNPNLFLPRIEYASYDAVNMSSSNLFSNHTYPQLKIDVGQTHDNNNENKKISTKMNEKNPKMTIVEKAGEFKQLEKTVIRDDRRKYNEGGNLNTIELVDRQESPTETKESIAKELARIFSPDIESDKKSVEHDDVMHNSETLHNEIRKLDPETSKYIENEHDIMKKAQYLIKDTRNATTNDFAKELYTTQDNDNYTLNEIVRVRRSLYNSSDTSKNKSEPHFGGAYQLKLNESENLLHREKRQAGAIIPHNHWCSIQVMRRNGNLDCTIWTYKKICRLECHPGFTHSGKEEITSQCSRKRGGRWSIDINVRCKASEYRRDPYYRSGDNQDVPNYRSEDSKSVAKPVTKASKESNSVSERNPGSKKEAEKSNDKKGSPPKESKSSGGSAENTEDDDYYENYDYPEK